MDHEYWSQRWAAGPGAFHEGRPNRFLEAHGAVLGDGRRVLVPLCGKAVDLVYLASRGHQVIGVELVESAVLGFFADQAVTPTVTRDGDFVRYEAGAITILQGDFFATTTAVLGPVDALYDRAALIALPAAMRTDYVAHLRALLPAGAPALVVTLEYPQAAMAGPPFAVLEDELRAHYAGAEVTQLADEPADAPRLRAAGATGRERCFAIHL